MKFHELIKLVIDHLLFGRNRRIYFFKRKVDLVFFLMLNEWFMGKAKSFTQRTWLIFDGRYHCGINIFVTVKLIFFLDSLLPHSFMIKAMTVFSFADFIPIIEGGNDFKFCDIFRAWKFISGWTLLFAGVPDILFNLRDRFSAYHHFAKSGFK